MQKRWLANSVFIIAIVTSVIYLVWRTFFTLPLSDGFLPAFFGCLLLVSEIAAAMGTYELYMHRLQNKKVDLTLPVIPLCWYPDVDVFIATHNEEPSLLYKTVNACVNFEYPDKRKVHIYLCDDGNRPEVMKLAEHFGIGYLGLANNREAKSGNFNNALAHTSSPLIATFDADMIGQHTFLMESVPYFFLPYLKKMQDGSWVPLKPEEVDPKYRMGLVQTPQSFYNPDLFQFNLYVERDIPNEQDFFSREINLMRNSGNACAYTGSNTLILRRALEEIGGFPTDTITEDFETGLMIQANGYTCLATDKVQASGLSTTTIKGMVTQRVRWARGVIQSIRNCQVPINPKLSLNAKFSYLSCFSYWWSFSRRIVYTLAPILFALFDMRIVICTFEQLLMFWLPSHFFYSLAQHFLSSNLRNQRWNQIIDTILAPYMVIPVFLETVGIQQKKFKVTDKRKQVSTTQWRYLLPHAAMLVLSIAGMVRFVAGQSGTQIIYGALIIFWLGYNIVNLLYAIYFVLGRRAFRSAERFNAEIPISIEALGRTLNGHTVNLSENGLMFAMSEPVCLPMDVPLTMRLDTDRYHVCMKARILFVDSAPDTGQRTVPDVWQYHCVINSMSEPYWREYLQIVYDRIHTLPKKLNVWQSAFDQLVNNQLQRMKRKRPERRRVPRVPIGRYIQFEEGADCIAVDFNYHYLLVRDLNCPGGIPKQLTLKLPGDIRIVCALYVSKRADPSERLLQVTNWLELVNHPDFPSALMSWLGRDHHEKAEDGRRESANNAYAV